MTKREQLIAWLGDAHAMEVGIVSTLEKHIADAEGLPKVRAALKKHLAETKQHAKAMEQALDAMGGSHPVLREGLSRVVNAVAGLSTSFVTDTPVKNAIADFATEHFEIACYTSLVQTADTLGEKKIAATCRKILKEEQAMAKTLAGQFKEVNAAYLGTLDNEPSKEDRPKYPLPKPVERRKPAAKAKPAAKKKAPAKPRS